MRTLKLCSICGCEVTASAILGRCAECGPSVTRPLFAPPVEESAPREGATFGRYELGPRIGSGGMGAVYRARDLKLGRDVALKMLHGGEYASTLALGLFQEEIRAFARLDHPHVVPIYEAGEHAGQLYFTMKLLPSDLKSQLRRFKGDTMGAVVLVEKIALAVRHLHQHGYLHRDLKPANILLDDADPPAPYVADFGVAKQIGADGQVLRTSVIVGTPLYMAPEQAAGKDVTWAADVYSLGVILYEVLVQELPFQGNTREIERAKQSRPKDLRAHDPRIDRELARICLRCLEPRPEHRYQSAVALAQALRRYINGEPPEDASWLRRAWRWCLRRPLLSGLIAGMLLFLALVTSRAFAVVGEQQAVLIQQANRDNATMIAGSVLSQIRALSDAVMHAAADEELVRAMGIDDFAGRQAALHAHCEKLYDYYEDPVHGLRLTAQSPFNMWLILDDEGMLMAQYRQPAVKNMGMDFAWRDYFNEAWKLGEAGSRSAHVSRAFKSEHDGYYKFAISSPIYDVNGRPVGVLVAGIASQATLASLELDDTQSFVTLVAPRDLERDETIPRSPYLILRHPGFAYGEAIGMDNEQVRQVSDAALERGRDTGQFLWPTAPGQVMSTPEYVDPVAAIYSKFSGTWSAEFAPVGNTGLVIVVQSREEWTLAMQVAIWSGISAIPGVLFALFAFVYRRRRSSAPVGH